jgi:hypothetical protein
MTISDFIRYNHVTIRHRTRHRLKHYIGACGVNEWHTFACGFCDRPIKRKGGYKKDRPIKCFVNVLEKSNSYWKVMPALKRGKRSCYPSKRRKMAQNGILAAIAPARRPLVPKVFTFDVPKGLFHSKEIVALEKACLDRNASTVGARSCPLTEGLSEERNKEIKEVVRSLVSTAMEVRAEDIQFGELENESFWFSKYLCKGKFHRDTPINKKNHSFEWTVTICIESLKSCFEIYSKCSKESELLRFDGDGVIFPSHYDHRGTMEKGGKRSVVAVSFTLKDKDYQKIMAI